MTVSHRPRLGRMPVLMALALLAACSSSGAPANGPSSVAVSSTSTTSTLAPTTSATASSTTVPPTSPPTSPVTSPPPASLSLELGGDYSVSYGTAGTVRIHQSATTFTISTTSPLTLENATCSLPIGTVLATFSGAGPSYSSTAYAFNASTCTPTGGAAGGNTTASTDGSVTIPGPTGVHLLVKTADAHPVAAPAAAGNYSVRFGTDGSVTVRHGGSEFTVSTNGPLTIESASCPLPTGTVLATFSGAGPSYSSTAYAFNATTCTPTGGAAGGTAYLNTDNTITLLTPTGWHLLSPA